MAKHCRGDDLIRDLIAEDRLRWDFDADKITGAELIRRAQLHQASRSRQSIEEPPPGLEPPKVVARFKLLKWVEIDRDGQRYEVSVILPPGARLCEFECFDREYAQQIGSTFMNVHEAFKPVGKTGRILAEI